MNYPAVHLLIKTRKLLQNEKASLFSRIITDKLFIRLKEILTHERTENQLNELYNTAPLFDCHESVPFNGVRSYLDVVVKSIEPIYNITSEFLQNDRKKIKTSIFVQYVDILEQMLNMSDIIIHMTSPPIDDHQVITKLLTIDQSVFFRSKIGFYLPDYLRNFFHSSASFIAGFRLDQARRSGHRITSLKDMAMMSTSDYQLRGKYLSFCSNFVDLNSTAKIWNITENFMFSFINVTFNRLSFNRIIKIAPKPLNFCSPHLVDGYSLLPPPRPVTARLMSYKMYNFLSSKEEGLADDFIVHFHGGGFISQTSASHITYLTELSRATGTPILSVDYSLSPQNPFPSALDECFFVYAWVLHNLTYLGTKGKRIILVGDSAGGNLALSVSTKAVLGEVRLPDGLALLYPCCSMGIKTVPSMFLSLIDPIVSLPAFLSAMAAYLEIDISSKSSEVVPFGRFSAEDVREVTEKYDFGYWIGDVVKKLKDSSRFSDILVSPANLNDELISKLPPIRIFVGNYDPLLDDSVEFARRLFKLGHDVDINFLDGFTHGFMQLYGISPDLNAGIDSVLQKISLLLN